MPASTSLGFDAEAVSEAIAKDPVMRTQVRQGLKKYLCGSPDPDPSSRSAVDSVAVALVDRPALDSNAVAA